MGEIMERKEPLTVHTIIGSRKITAAEFRKFFKKMMGEDYEKHALVRNVIKASVLHKGKTLEEIIQESYHPSGDKNLEELLAENRYRSVSESDKMFIIAFDKALSQMGYDFGGSISMTIIYGKTGTKTRACPARIYIDDRGIKLQLYLTKIDSHRAFIESAPPHIKDVFTNRHGLCTQCNFKDGKCKYKNTKTYTVDGRLINRCNFIFDNPRIEELPAYMSLLSEFFQSTKVKNTQIITTP